MTKTPDVAHMNSTIVLLDASKRVRVCSSVQMQSGKEEKKVAAAGSAFKNTIMYTIHGCATGTG
jgi:hypothetical protein